MPRSPIPDMIERFHNMTSEERSCFLDLVDPQPEPEPVKKSSKKSATNSKRASGMAEAIKNSLDRGKQETSNALCVARVPTLDVLCGEREDALIHDLKGGYTSYHPFEAPAPVAGKKSSRKSAAPSLIPSTGTEEGNALVVGASGD